MLNKLGVNLNKWLRIEFVGWITHFGGLSGSIITRNFLTDWAIAGFQGL
jgi:hypothetical protein